MEQIACNSKQIGTALRRRRKLLGLSQGQPGQEDKSASGHHLEPGIG
jgi:hypothetical protein